MTWAKLLADFIVVLHATYFSFVVFGLVLILLGLAFGAMLLTFLTDVPIALKSGAQAEVMLGLKKAIVKTVLLGALFGLAYLVAGIRAIAAARR